jgi:phosphoadenosine phosphosulfate reductase
MKEILEEIQKQFALCSPDEILRYFLGTYRDKIALASSLGAEDQVLTDFIVKIDPQAKIFTLDTGRLHQETYNVITKTMQHYGIRYEIYCPQTAMLESMESRMGPDLFYENTEYRKYCCQVRKLESLKRALNGLMVWITGLRKEQGPTRSGIHNVEWDPLNNLVKLNPLADWTTEQVWEYIKKNNVPYNRLHDRGYSSIGCAPCTRAIKPGEDERAGRWWWEETQHKECGLHYQDGKLVRG